ncbi:MAG: class I SAM-dependent methyltransferase [Bacteroidales bacterium]
MATLLKDQDPLGAAAYKYWSSKEECFIDVHSDLCEMDHIPASYLFREFKEMPKIEKKALKQCKGKILDIGAGVGSHSLYLQNKGLDITALEISPFCVDIMKDRGIDNIVFGDFNEIKVEKYDTLLLLMNGIGICGQINNLALFLTRCKQFLNDGGELLLDSSDLSYMYEGEDEAFMPSHYIGEVRYTMGFEDVTGPAFDWLFIDFDKLKEEAVKCGFTCEKIINGPHYDYLARLKAAK